MTAPDPALAELARLYGIQTAYRDVAGRRQAASAPTLLAALAALGAPVGGAADVGPALRERRAAMATRIAPSVVVAWGRASPRVDCHVVPGADGDVACRLVLEDGSVREWSEALEDCDAVDVRETEGVHRVVRRLVVPGPLPFGYHRLELTVERGLVPATAQTLIVCAPREAPGPGRPSPSEGRAWGAFLPVYALRSGRNWGVGDLTDLRDLLEWIRSLGGQMAAALPFFASFFGEWGDDSFDPSPYSPASRLFWNELFLDVTSVPELAASPEARDQVGSPALRAELDSLRASPTVEYRRAMAAKRRVLELLSDAMTPERRRAFDTFVASDPLLDDYARFRSACEVTGRPWPEWPGAQRAGVLESADVDENRYHYHRYAQWLLHEQLEALADKEGSGPLYLDLPIGVNPAGFDVWRERSCFVVGASAGAPPDNVFTKGQDWGFPPMHPEGIRETGYRYPAACFRRMLRYAGLLRIDHVMGLHRLYVIPPGVDAAHGVYVRYPAEELYAVLLLEAHRAGALLLGEDLGTVPGYVRTAMDEHNVHRSFVVEYELAGGAELRPPGRRDVASVNTHDMPTFAAFWRGADIDDRLALGLLDEQAAAGEREQRDETRHHLATVLRKEGHIVGDGPAAPRDVLTGCLAHLAASESAVVVVNLEDLWLEEEPQNVPGTTAADRPNWRRKAARSLDEMRSSPEVAAALESVERARQRSAGG